MRLLPVLIVLAAGAGAGAAFYFTTPGKPRPDLCGASRDFLADPLAVAASGDAEGQVQAAWRHLNTIGPVPHDPARARALFQAAADAGHDEGDFGLGWIHSRGLGVPRDVALANSHFRAAADRGNACAAYSLARNLERGRGGPTDRTSAIHYYQIARPTNLKAWLPLARLMLDSLHPETFQPRQGILLLIETAEQGEPAAQFFLAQSRLNGHATQWNPRSGL
ncbi:tetratricopeptide repeat protein [Zavarzinia sp. CC-PAN008]|uniref:tetratricopeptide repeat protein n=1 Tax=Zavarzinia sp. CC-PAN008 TaxID=3243332 RepID=UPI003F747292